MRRCRSARLAVLFLTDGKGNLPPALGTYNSHSGFTDADFGCEYTGALPGLVGTFQLTPTALLFTVTSLPVGLQSFRVG